MKTMTWGEDIAPAFFISALDEGERSNFLLAQSSSEGRVLSQKTFSSVSATGSLNMHAKLTLE
jgi:hypothetical protein